jgi:hypothetical protein
MIDLRQKVSLGEECDLDKVTEYLDDLEGSLADSPVEEWPIEFVDTMIVARTRLGADTAYLSEWAPLTEIVRRAMQIGKRTHKELEGSREDVQLVRRLLIEPSAGVRPSA